MNLQRVTNLPALPPRDDDTHKGTYGRVLIVAGSRGMAGAASLTGLGALRGGAGLVYLAVPEGVASTVSAVEPSYLTKPLAEDEDGRIAADPREEPFTSLLDDKSALAVGPGLGQSRNVSKIVARLYEKFIGPAVFDADALNSLAKSPKSLSKPGGPRVLTPHPGEFARLIDSDVKTVESDRENLAAKFAAENGVILLLKGHRTIITDGKRIAVNATGNSGMATGGCGDVLTGLIAALLGQKMKPFDAAQFGAHLHGLAGDLAAEELSKPGIIASDVAKSLAYAWKRFSS
ncbi:MAG: NAD(P)H-hydrate dehydratase [Planctomycetota bacterium]|nr:NAD(P)H-hydrate dehydratase [Planctomycetaceae bacterium]MDQ3332521.1 NAD(P)H-hydrate dehydratase [Planctomycetota bacterium]